MDTIKQQWTHFVATLQNTICTELELCDGKAVFIEDKWKRPGGGGGSTRIIGNGNVFEKGGVNISEVYGEVSNNMREHLHIQGTHWFACGLSLVLHPVNPFVPTVHCNYRMFELYNEQQQLTERWFGGGADLTPYYLFEEDAVHFHSIYHNVCNLFDAAFYPSFKKQCDDYFVNTHRNNERRGIGGIFFDYVRASQERSVEFLFQFVTSCANAFLPSYLPIVHKRKNIPYNQQQKHWQEIRRGRYIEFNLIHDRGTLFGLKTNGRTESILMSLPPTARFEYDYTPPEHSPEEELLQVCLHPKEWI